MFKFCFRNFILKLHDIPPEYILIISLIICYIIIIILYKIYKDIGLYLYVSISLIACNMQVLKAVKFTWYDEPVVLGSIIFGTIYLVSDILNEFYGVESAKKSIFLGFLSSITLFFLMIPIVGIRPIDNSLSEYQHFNIAHESLMNIFTPSIYLFISSLIAFFFSQMTDIYIFAKVKIITNNKKLWFRTLLSLFAGCLVDNVIFNSFAWVILSPEPISLRSLFYNYIISSYIIQISVALINIPIFYLIKKII